jgi:hypothetical protein
MLCLATVFTGILVSENTVYANPAASVAMGGTGTADYSWYTANTSASDFMLYNLLDCVSLLASL